MAEDLVQETFLTAAEKIDAFEGRSGPRTWLFGILNNKILEHYRSRLRNSKVRSTDPGELEQYFDETGRWRSEQTRPPWGGGEEHLLDDPLFRKVFYDCLAELPTNWRAALSLKFLDERPAETICQELGISVTHYWQLIHRAKLRMRSCIEKGREADE